MARFRCGWTTHCGRASAHVRVGAWFGDAWFQCATCRSGAAAWMWQVDGCSATGIVTGRDGRQRTRSAALRAIRREIARRIAAESAPEVLDFPGGIATGRAEVRL